MEIPDAQDAIFNLPRHQKSGSSIIHPLSSQPCATKGASPTDLFRHSAIATADGPKNSTFNSLRKLFLKLPLNAMSAFLHSWLADFQPGGFQKVGLVTPCEPSDFGLRFRTPHSKFRIGNARPEGPSFSPSLEGEK